MSAGLSQRLVPDGLWELVAPLLPSFNSRPQGGGTAPLDERAVFTAVVYVLTSGCAWRYLPETFGVSPATAHRRFTAWTEVGLWRRLHRAVLDELGAQATIAQPDDQRLHRKRRGRAGGRPPALDKAQYRRRNAVERCVNKWKQFRAVATRYDKRDYIFNGTPTVTAIVIWLRDTVQEPSETA
ncbi:transposase [Streptomyces phyllanthi]|uniref:Transposase n=1 Tax=Streptomyces phyllanthi TaxID=1803180 RepID=A0A5N8W3N8_9ACTN|nr:transposase [Streptomyces phyllanthi]